MQDEIVDVVVVGGGVAGCVCAYELAKAGREVILIERGSECGSKNLSGGVFYSKVMEEIFDDFLSNAPVERKITKNIISFLNESSALNIDYYDERLNGNAVSVLRAKFDAWLASKCEEAGVMILPSTRVDKLAKDGDKIVGVVAGDDVLKARVVVLADGANSFLASEGAIRQKQPAKNLAVGVKAVIGLDEKTICERFSLNGDEGAAYAVVGAATCGVAGGGFIYTNKKSVSIGVVLQLGDLQNSSYSSTQILDSFLTHQRIAPLIKDGELLEYGAHMTIENGPAMVTEPISAPGLLVIGDAAGFTLNAGFVLRGMDLAAGSAQAAAKAVNAAFAADDFDNALQNGYKNELAKSWVGQDMARYKNAPKFLANPLLYGAYGELVADLFYDIFRHDLRPKQPLWRVALNAANRHKIGLWQLAKDALGALKSL